MFASAAACGATPESFLPPGLHKATRADVVAAGRACGNGTPLSPSYLLKVGAADAEHAPAAIAVLRDDGGVALPVVPKADSEGYALSR
jgi:hypothetical protein